MILSFLTEDIDNQKLNNEYTRNYSDIPEEDFMLMVKMDPNSYPKGTENYDATEPDRVGNLAGGNGVLIRCYRNGDKDFLKDFKTVQDACIKYTKNRGSYDIKNPSVFKTVNDFVKYVNGEATNVDQQQAAPTKKQQTPEEKLEVLRQKQFPQIETVQELIDVAKLDEDTEIETGQIGNIARNLLLPHYAAGERDFLIKPVSLKTAIANYNNAAGDQQKEKPISKYNEKDGKEYKFTIIDFIKDWSSSSKSANSNVMNLLKHYAVEGRDYEIVCQTTGYDVIRYWTDMVGWIVGYCDASIEQFRQDKIENGRGANDSEYGTNRWCTGWEDSYQNSYASNGQVLIAFIARDRVPFDVNDRTKNYQISIYSDGRWHDIEGGNNSGGVSTNWPKLKLILEQNKEIIPYLLQYQQVRKNKDLSSLAQSLGINYERSYKDTGPIGLAWEWDDKVEVEPEPFIFKDESDIDTFKLDKKGIPQIDIKHIKIADGVTEIPDFTFQNWEGLERVEFPDSLKVIGNKAFSGCTRLRKLKLPPNLEDIGMGAFENCFLVSGNIRLPITLTHIGANCFRGHGKKGITFTVSPKIFTSGHKLNVPDEKWDRKFWLTPGRVKFSDN